MAKNKISIEDILKCRKCNKPFRKIDEYTYTPDCDCYNRKFYISVGRKCEPLVGKIVKLCYGWEDSLEFTGFDYDDIKSAVEGLKQEIDNKIADIWICPCCKTPLVLKDMKKEINTIVDKWFEDVI